MEDFAISQFVRHNISYVLNGIYFFHADVYKYTNVSKITSILSKLISYIILISNFIKNICYSVHSAVFARNHLFSSCILLFNSRSFLS